MTTRATVFFLSLFLWVGDASAMRAGQYYYFIADQCEARGPTTQKERDAITPDVLLFEIVPAGISDYNVNINTKALQHYTQEGMDYLSSLEVQQVYTAGRDAETRLAHHSFLLQREAINRQTLVSTLRMFSQQQSDQGYFYKQALSLTPDNQYFKAITKVDVQDSKNEGYLLITGYVTQYYKLDATGKSDTSPFLSVDHLGAMKLGLHDREEPYYHFLHRGICGEKWLPLGGNG